MNDQRRRMGGAELESVAEHRDEFARLRAPYRNAEITLIDKTSGEVALVEIRIREGRRITTVELDADTVDKFAGALQDWAERAKK